MENISVHQCPQCARVINFSHALTTILVCTCGAVINRKDGDFLVSKPFYVIQEKFEIIQPGTTGSWERKEFTVLGRFRAWAEEFVFNYWTILYNDGNLGILGESYGLYAIYHKIQLDTPLLTAQLDKLKVGDKRELFLRKQFLLERKYTCYKWEVEGEVYLPDCNSSFRFFEFASSSGRNIELIEFLNNYVQAFEVRYTSFSDLHLANTKSYNPVPEVVTCTHCSKPNELKAYPLTQSFACLHCGSRFALKDGIQFQKLQSRNKTDVGTYIELGAKGIIKGIEYEVIGYALKEERNKYRSQWKEYTLFSDTEGFAFLSEYNGHWMYAREKGDGPVLYTQNVHSFNYEEEPFQLYNSYRYDTVNAAGAFPYNLFDDGDKDIKEFISPPEMWIMEKSPTEGIVWFLGEHISGKEIEQAFGEKVVLPYKEGVGAIEPKNYISIEKLVGATIIGVLILVFLHILSGMTKLGQVIMVKEFSFNDTTNTVSFVSPPFLLNKWRSNLEFDIYAPVDNSWMELNATLINTQTGTEYSLEKGVEYYHGYSEGENWSEGDTRESGYLTKIPKGAYKLQIEGIREQSYSIYSSPTVNNFHLTVKYDVTNHRNLIICIAVLLVWAFVQYKITEYNEKNRWYHSPYSPYSYED